MWSAKVRSGVAHYGLFADLLAEMQRGPGGEPAMRTLFRSAEAYLRMWERARGGQSADRRSFVD